MSKIGEPKSKICSVEESQLYRYISIIDEINKFIKWWVNLNTAAIEENHVNEKDFKLRDFRVHIVGLAEELDKKVHGTKNVDRIF